MKLYVTRHGETEYSLKGVVCGTTDCPLTDFGRQQALSLAEEIRGKGIKIDMIYSSPLIRAKETAEVLAAKISVPIVVDERLREQDCGGFEGKAKRDDKRFSNARFHFANSLDGGESTLQLAQRVYNFLDELLDEKLDKAALIVGHACVCKIIHTYFYELSNEEYFHHNTGNCELVEYG